MTINMNFGKKEDEGKNGEKKIISEKLGTLDKYLKYAQKSADCVMSVHRQERERFPHETVVVL